MTNPPRFVVPALLALRDVVGFCVTMVAHQAWGWVFLGLFSWHMSRALRRAERYIEVRVHLKAGLPVPDR